MVWCGVVWRGVYGDEWVRRGGDWREDKKRKAGEGEGLIRARTRARRRVRSEE